ncbi:MULTISPECIES: copper chaperone PCu(A)C [unclassified Luteimonas]|jgi:copper(I)-binding protein|uniref:copper chaperone PCu(A)C n=1 Tax=unclassified Luteimonas TaxID=2629088 RepID=UPI00047D99E6|nr:MULTISPECIES: copper chaperone PCu(A)C [unclassified Luteimonas]
MNASIPLLGATLLLALSGAARAGDCLPEIDSAWIRKPPMAMPMMAGFAEIRNPCAEPVRIVAARSPAFGAVELHETTRVDGVSRMRHVEALDVPARGTVVLAPGGLHLMLMQPKDEAVEGSTLEVELELDDGRRLAAGFQVRAPGAL